MNKIYAFEKYIFDTLKMSRLPCSTSSVSLLVMVAAHESGKLKYVQQMSGPALGLFQMEPTTYVEVLDYAKRRKLLETKAYSLPPEAMIWDAKHAIRLARIFFMRFPENIPAVHNLQGLARYAKKYWNTERGKATWTDYYEAYLEMRGKVDGVT